MELNDRQLTALEELVDELMKHSPEESKITSCLQQVGLKDPKDPLDRIQTVLDALQFEYSDKEFKE